MIEQNGIRRVGNSYGIIALRFEIKILVGKRMYDHLVLLLTVWSVRLAEKEIAPFPGQFTGSSVTAVVIIILGELLAHSMCAASTSGAGSINAYTRGYAGYRDRRTHNEAFIINLTRHIKSLSVGRVYLTVIVGIFRIPRPIDKMTLQ